MTLSPCLMVQGTGSGAGKSTLTAGLCRLFARAGYRVAPFKSQNMALNSAVTVDGGEIARAQAAQAEAAGVAPTVDMNPVLLKPETEHRSQVVVRGAPVGSVDFHAYQRMTSALLPIVTESLERLRHAHDLVIIEGAGSPAEINLNAAEIVNMRVARLADARVLLVGDIERGGVFAAFVGTLALLPPEDRARVGGFIVNRFRGDAALLAPGLHELRARTGVPVLGVVPYFRERLMPPEDSLDLDHLVRSGGATVDIAVVRLPRIANFDDLEPLAAEPGVRVRFVSHPTELEGADLVVLPGSKSTIDDLRWLRERGLAASVIATALERRPVLGICGGYQMLGIAVRDPYGVESSVEEAPGLGLLPVVTTFERSKTTTLVAAVPTAEPGLFSAARGEAITAYEIHAGRTRWLDGTPENPSRRRPFTIVARRGCPATDFDGATDEAGTVQGTYLHGLFANTVIRRAVLTALVTRRGKSPDPRWGTGPVEDRYDRLAEIVATAVDMSAIAGLAGLAYPRPGLTVTARS